MTATLTPPRTTAGAVTARGAETMREARSWDVRRAEYTRAGLCCRCASQAAYGHAQGFLTVAEPCADCGSIVAAFPTVEAGGWRSLPRRSVPAPRARAGRQAEAPAYASHGACGQRWRQVGNRTGHCPSCHRTFSGLRAYDDHRTDGVCLDVTTATRPDGSPRFVAEPDVVGTLHYRRA